MHKKITFSCYEWDIIYILNCICLTKDILKNGRTEFFEKYFKKENYNTYMYDLTLIQKLIGYKANKEIYNYEDFDFFIGQRDYLAMSDGTFKFLTNRSRLRKIKKEIKIRKNVKNNFAKCNAKERENKSHINNFKNYFIKLYRFYS